MLSPLALYGYNSREAEWLALVMMHSGAFLRRQYLTFLGGRSPGAADHRLVAQLQALQHVEIFPYHGREHLYHVRARRLYAALGYEHSRLRRGAPALLVAQRLLVLDFVLGEPRPYLASEETKVRHFTEIGIPLDQLPHRVYSATRAGRPATTRYFVQRFPIAVDDATTTFVVPDLFPRSAEALADFLREYAALLAALPCARVVYVTPQGEPAIQAETIFNRAYLSPQKQVETAERLHSHFLVRQALDQSRYGQVSEAALKTYTRDRDRFAAAPYMELYDVWRGGGVVALTHALQPPSGTVTFRHVPMRWRYYGVGATTRSGGPTSRPRNERSRRRSRRNTT